MSLTDEQRMAQVHDNYQIVQAIAQLAKLDLDIDEDEKAISKMRYLTSFLQEEYNCTITSTIDPLNDVELKDNRDVVVGSDVYEDFLAYTEAIAILVTEHKFKKKPRQKGKPYDERLKERGLSLNKKDKPGKQLREATRWFVNGPCKEWNNTKKLFFKL